MTKKNRLVPVLITGTVLVAGAYALSRVATKVKQARGAAAQHDAPERLQHASLTPDPLTLDLSDLFDVQALDAVENGDPVSVTVRVAERVPSASSADDEEAIAPEELGESWLSHATQAERSWSESAPLDLEEIAAPMEEQDEAEAEGLDEASGSSRA